MTSMVGGIMRQGAHGIRLGGYFDSMVIWLSLSPPSLKVGSQVLDWWIL